MFRSYEPGREKFVTLIANYLPLQEPYGGPNYFILDNDAVYEIHVDNDGDAVEDLTFQFRLQHSTLREQRQRHRAQRRRQERRDPAAAGRGRSTRRTTPRSTSGKATRSS